MKKKVLFIGSKPLGLQTLKTIYSLDHDNFKAAVTIDDSTDIRSNLSEFRRFTSLKKIKLYVIRKSAELKNVIESEGPDIIFVQGWYWVIKPDVLKLVPGGFICMHFSLLPKYRGFAPLVWTIINGDKTAGVSMFYLDEGIDTGDIIAQQKFNIRQSDTIADALNKVDKIIVSLLKKNYFPILKNNIKPIRQNHSQATYCSERKPEDGHLNWKFPAEKIHNLIRAQTLPYPGAFSFLNGRKVYILESEVYDKPYYGIPGLVAQIFNNNVVVTCGEGAIVVKKSTEVLKYGMRLL